jgi:hypothetical protein
LPERNVEKGIAEIGPLGLVPAAERSASAGLSSLSMTPNIAIGVSVAASGAASGANNI